jgi:hypothetical protein
MEPNFVTDADITTRIDLHGSGCRCALHPADAQRRLFTRLLVGAGAAVAAGPLLAREGVDVGGNSKFTKLVSAGQIEQAAQQQYLQMRQEADRKSVV